VVVPVYKGHLETLRCLHSVLVARTSTPFELVVINDASPDKKLAADLEQLAEQGLFTLYRNSSNRGFVYTANRGLRLHPQRDVVLLNADTEVFDGWLDRLVSAANRNERTGTVTPLSNNATICSYPQFLQDNPYPLELGYAELDGLAAAVNAAEEVEAPTAVGFCTYLRRVCLDDVGLFDEETFGRGYGEENDFSLRASARGWRNVIVGDVFVYHSGSASFQGEKAKALHTAMAILGKRYPTYHSDVAAFIDRDPLAEWRRRLDWGRLCRLSREKNVLIIVHGRGGGTERHVQEDIRAFKQRGYGVYLLRPVPALPTHFELSHHATKTVPNIRPFAIADTARLGQALRELQITDVHTHSLIDAVPDAPKHVTDLVRAIDARWEANLHDYKVMCPRINLVDERGRYCGEPSEAACNRCLESRGSIFGRPDIREWRVMHRRALHAADAVLVPDADMADRLLRYFPEVDFKVSPHDDVDESQIEISLPRLDSGEDLHVVVIGAISEIKGYDVLLACAKDAKKRRLPLRFTLMGYSVNDRQLEKAGVQVTGRYLEGQGLSLLRSLEPHVIWLPSLWPETYSYTLSLALQVSRPVFAFDIGAIAARLRRLGQADMLVPLLISDSPQALNARLLACRRRWGADAA
jgi:GT2 family glycosyltransferase/glycosyltransferase involved in cell wall biosynthesis